MMGSQRKSPLKRSLNGAPSRVEERLAAANAQGLYGPPAKPDQIVTDEYDFPAREEHNAQGRWVSPDPMRGTGNKYVYADNNPLHYVDPYGLWVDTVESDSGSGDGSVADGWLDFFDESRPLIALQTGGQPQVQKPCKVDICKDVWGKLDDWNAAANAYWQHAWLSALGHHGIPRAVFRVLKNKYPEAYRFLNKKFVTGRLMGEHYYDGPHRAYNKAVRDLLKLDTEEGQQELASDVVKGAQKVLDSDDPLIKGFLDNLPKTADGMTGRQALEKAVTDLDGEALGDFMSSAVGEITIDVMKVDE